MYMCLLEQTLPHFFLYIQTHTGPSPLKGSTIVTNPMSTQSGSSSSSSGTATLVKKESMYDINPIAVNNHSSRPGQRVTKPPPPRGAPLGATSAGALDNMYSAGTRKPPPPSSTPPGNYTFLHDTLIGHTHIQYNCT